MRWKIVRIFEDSNQGVRKVIFHAIILVNNLQESNEQQVICKTRYCFCYCLTEILPNHPLDFHKRYPFFRAILHRLNLDRILLSFPLCLFEMHRLSLSSFSFLDRPCVATCCIALVCPCSAACLYHRRISVKFFLGQLVPSKNNSPRVCRALEYSCSAACTIYCNTWWVSYSKPQIPPWYPNAIKLNAKLPFLSTQFPQV